MYLNPNFIVETGHIEINNGIIGHINNELPDDIKVEQIIDCSNLLILPGLVNAHTHNPETLGRGIFSDCLLENWCNKSPQGVLQSNVFDYLDNASEHEFHILLLKSYSEYLKQGITFLVDSGQADNAELKQQKAMKEIGLQGIIDAYDAIDKVHDKSNNQISFCSHLPEEEDITDEYIKGCQSIKNKMNVMQMTHCLETRHRVKLIKDLSGKSTVQYFSEKGLLDKNTILFHLTYADSEDLKLIRKKGATAVYCPISNAWSSAGRARLEEWLDAGVNTTLGTDFLLSDFWEVMRNSYYYLKTEAKISTYRAEDIFKMATTNGGRAFMKSNMTAEISKGSQADLIFIDKSNPKLWPILNKPHFSNILYNILMNGSETVVKHVMIKGKWIIRDFHLQTVDEAYLNTEYSSIIEKVLGA